MEAQEASHNTNASLPPTSPSHTRTPGEQARQPAIEKGETTVKLTIEEKGRQMLVETKADIAHEGGEGTRVVQVNEQKTEKLLFENGAHASIQAEKTANILQVAEADAKQLLLEAEEHEVVKITLEDAKTFGDFWLKFLNDWVLNFASGLAYSLLMAMFPVVIALGATIGFISGDLTPHNQQVLINQLSAIFPSVLGSNVLAPALGILQKDAGPLGLLAVVLALYNGSRLFVALENYFAIIYHTPSRSFWRQNLMALVMLLIFIILIPIMLLASSIGLGGFVGGVIASVLLFQAIYMVVPNQHISLRNSWRGTLVAAIALQVYVAIFPLYIRRFLGSYTGNTGFAIILLLFFYYFAVILLLGAEVNAFYAEDVRAMPKNLADLVHQATIRTDKKELARLARQKAAPHTPERF